MGKLIVIMVGLAGVFFLTNRFMPSLLHSGPAMLAFDGFQPPWILLIGAGFVLLAYKAK